MARLPRLNIIGIPQHIIQRGNDRQPCFFAGEDYAYYLEKLKEAAEKHQAEVHAFVLMTNHTHLLITPKQVNSIPKIMQSLGRYYVRYINSTYQRTGTLWEGRYKSTLIDSEQYLLTAMRYIELNPVRAGMVDHPAEYPWSSYHFHADGNAKWPTNPHEIYQKLGRNSVDRQTCYRALFKSHIPEKSLEEIRQATNKGWALGDTRFRTMVEQMVDRPAGPRPRGGNRKS